MYRFATKRTGKTNRKRELETLAITA